jgi:hypothetical protein
VKPRVQTPVLNYTYIEKERGFNKRWLLYLRLHQVLSLLSGMYLKEYVHEPLFVVVFNLTNDH